MKRLLGLCPALVLSIALLAGCGGGKEHNAQDVSFAKDMVPHHEQAVVMSDLALAQAGSPQVKDLATRIKAAQGPEITTMKGWLSSWGEKIDDMGSMDMSTMPGMEGMLNGGELESLRSASGSQFDRLYLEGMTGHHQGAIGMSKAEIDSGKFPAAQALARQITSSQEKEIAEMADLLRSVPA